MLFKSIPACINEREMMIRFRIYWLLSYYIPHLLLVSDIILFYIYVLIFKQKYQFHFAFVEGHHRHRFRNVQPVMRVFNLNVKYVKVKYIDVTQHFYK